PEPPVRGIAFRPGAQGHPERSGGDAERQDEQWVPVRDIQWNIRLGVRHLSRRQPGIGKRAHRRHDDRRPQPAYWPGNIERRGGRHAPWRASYPDRNVAEWLPLTHILRLQRLGVRGLPPRYRRRAAESPVAACAFN